MKIYTNIPQPFTDDWAMSTVRHPSGAQFPFHYHDVEEWLQVLEGEIYFFSAGEQEYRLGVGQVLQISRGEVHRVEIGPTGVAYQMWTPVAGQDLDFVKELSDAEMTLIRENLLVPQHENKGGDAAQQFFERFLSEQLTFRTASGAVLSKARFIGNGFVDRKRRASDSISILYKSSETLFLSTVVTLPGEDEQSQAYTNDRLFIRERGLALSGLAQLPRTDCPLTLAEFCVVLLAFRRLIMFSFT